MDEFPLMFKPLYWVETAYERSAEGGILTFFAVWEVAALAADVAINKHSQTTI